MDARRRMTPETWAVLGLAALALGVRLWGLTFDLPSVTHVDEAWFGQKAIDYFKGDLNPHFWHVPSLYTYLVAAVWWVYFILGKLLGNFPDAAAFIRAYHSDPTVPLILGRLVTVVLSLGTIALTYRVGKKMYDWRVGAAAALFLTLSPEHNRISHYMNPDSPMLFFLMAALLFIWRVYRTGRTRDYLLAGASAGLAFAMKYGGLPLFVPLFLAHLFFSLDNRRPKWRLLLHPPLLAAGLLAVVVFFVTCPYAALDFPRFSSDFRWQSEHLVTAGHYGSSTEENVPFFYLRYGFRENAGPLVQWLVFGGLLLALARLRRREVVLVSFPLLILAMISVWKTYAVRYLLPTAPFFLLVAALFFTTLSGWVGTGLGRLRAGPGLRLRLEWWVPAILLVLFALPSAVKVTRLDWSLAHKDTRTVASEWIHDYLPAGSNVAYEAYCPYVSEKRFHPFSRQPSLGVIDFEWLKWKKIDFVIVSELEFGRFLAAPKEFPKQARFYASLDEKAVLIKTFAPRWREDLLTMHNPVIKIYRIGRASDPSFPGNFGRFAQTVSLLKTQEGRWSLRSQARADGPRVPDERVGAFYVRVQDAARNVIVSLTLERDPAAAAGDDVLAGTARSVPIPAGAAVVIGYDYELTGLTGGWEIPRTLKREFLLARSLGEGALQRTRLDFHFFYAAFPGTRGDDYFQNVMIVHGDGWNCSSSAYGGELKWGDDQVVDPFARITDAAGHDLARVLLFKGPAGSFEAAQAGPLRVSATLPDLPDDFRVFVGYAHYLDNALPGRAGGPDTLEIPRPGATGPDGR
ncbi:MAG: glycosyltransferase family 39 protein [Candidatus Aminicenantes bacterium]|nr:glycosyltransferase family 39 protein [Candidatus Aminicenantes bacterium]